MDMSIIPPSPEEKYRAEKRRLEAIARKEAEEFHGTAYFHLGGGKFASAEY